MKLPSRLLDESPDVLGEGIIRILIAVQSTVFTINVYKCIVEMYRNALRTNLLLPKRLSCMSIKQIRLNAVMADGYSVSDEYSFQILLYKGYKLEYCLYS